MSTTIFVLLWSLVCALFVLGATRVVSAWRRLRGARLVTCPETGSTAAVTLDRTRAVFAAFGAPSFRLASCSRWSSGIVCGQECLPQIEAAPDDCAVRTIAHRWFAARTCVYCRRAIVETPFVRHDPALLGKDGRTIEWSQVPPENLPALFKTDRPVCWNCHVAETFRRMYPELVTDRPNVVSHDVRGTVTSSTSKCA